MADFHFYELAYLFNDIDYIIIICKMDRVINDNSIHFADVERQEQNK